MDTMTTLLITHPASPRSLNAARPSRAARPAARDRERARAREVPAARARAGADGRRSRPSRSAIRWTTSRRSATPSPKEGLVQLDADTSMSPGTLRGGAARASAARCSRSTRWWPGRPTTPSSRSGRPAITPRPCGRWASASSTGRDRGAPCAEEARPASRRDRRFRRASRQRHAGDLLVRPDA